jgi:hypothetical protein
LLPSVEATEARGIERRISIRRGVLIQMETKERVPWQDAAVTEPALTRARAGDEDAFRELTDPLRRELQLHIYRIVGSAQDAEDLLQETLLAAWRGLDQFEGRPSSSASCTYRPSNARYWSCATSSAASPRRSREAAWTGWWRC